MPIYLWPLMFRMVLYETDIQYICYKFQSILSKDSSTRSHLSGQVPRNPHPKGLLTFAQSGLE